MKLQHIFLKDRNVRYKQKTEREKSLQVKIRESSEKEDLYERRSSKRESEHSLETVTEE